MIKRTDPVTDSFVYRNLIGKFVIIF
ncbi:hypothetical protein SAMN05216463_104155, partial [Xylanibacter ruminicola]